MTAPALDPSMDPGPLTAAICDIESVSGNEGAVADAVEAALRESSHLRVERDGNAVFAFTDAGRSERVVVAGHLDTVPVADNLPCRVDGGRHLRLRHDRHEERRRSGPAARGLGARTRP